MIEEWLDSKQFYELMQAYRWADRHHVSPQAPAAAFEAVKDYIRKMVLEDEIAEAMDTAMVGQAVGDEWRYSR